jgi:hypothetical protein
MLLSQFGDRGSVTVSARLEQAAPQLFQCRLRIKDGWGSLIFLRFRVPGGVEINRHRVCHVLCKY